MNRLAVFDIDGCLIPERQADVAISPLDGLRRLSLRHGGALFTFATGRAVMYALAMAELLAVRIPVAGEHGAILLDPLDLSVRWTSREAERAWPRLRAEAERRLAPILPRVWLEPGKMATLSLHPKDGDVSALWQTVSELLATLPLTVNCSHLAVDVIYRGVDKGTAVALLAEHLKRPLEFVLAVGDALGDVPMLQRAGFAACPANAARDAREAVAAKGRRGYESREGFTAGVLAALHWYLEATEEER